MREVLAWLRCFSLYANTEKCKFVCLELSFLGFIVGKEGIQMDPDWVTMIAEWSRPQNVHDVQVFLGFVNFYRRFIEGYSHITYPLTDLL